MVQFSGGRRALGVDGIHQLAEAAGVFGVVNADLLRVGLTVLKIYNDLAHTDHRRPAGGPKLVILDAFPSILGVRPQL